MAPCWGALNWFSLAPAPSALFFLLLLFLPHQTEKHTQHDPVKRATWPSWRCCWCHYCTYLVKQNNFDSLVEKCSLWSDDVRLFITSDLKLLKQHVDRVCFVVPCSALVIVSGGGCCHIYLTLNIKQTYIRHWTVTISRLTSSETSVSSSASLYWMKREQKTTEK